MRTDSTSTYVSRPSDGHPFVLEIASDVQLLPDPHPPSSAESPDVVRLLTVVAPAPSAFDIVAESSVAAPVVSTVPCHRGDVADPIVPKRSHVGSPTVLTRSSRP